MTHIINQWQRPEHVKAIQSSKHFQHISHFDIHPNNSEPLIIQQLAKKFNLPHEPMFLKQVHGCEVIEYLHQPKVQLKLQADACFTQVPGILCAVMTADCLPVLLTDRAGSFVAAVHCGWRSLYANILSKTLKRINSDNQILAWFGPCIQQMKYEVDESFVNYYLAQHPNSKTAFTTITAGKSYASIYNMARIQLNQLGVTHIESADQCTYLSPEYYSWRKNNTTNRMATMIWMDTPH